MTIIPWQAWLVAGVLLAAGTYHLYATNAAYEAGRRAALASINEKSAAAARSADEAERAWRACPPAKRREDRTCAP